MPRPNILMSSLRAALFDLDGTLCHSDHLHYAAWRDELAASPSPFDLSYEEYKSRISGKPNSLIAHDFLPLLDSDQRALVCASKETRFRELATGPRSLAPLNGLLDLIVRLRSSGVSLACVTNAPRINAEFMLHQLGLTSCFEHLIIGEECSASKPSPTPYLEAMQRFKVEPDACVIFEDSFSGLSAACASKSALVIGLCTTHSADALKQMGAHAAVQNYSEIDFDELRHLRAPS